MNSLLTSASGSAGNLFFVVSLWPQLAGSKRIRGRQSRNRDAPNLEEHEMDKRFERCMALSVEQLDLELSPSRSAKDAGGALGRMVRQTKEALCDPGLDVRQDISYGNRVRQKLDVFRPKAAGTSALPCLVFIHGGFWQEGDKSVSGFAAQTFCAAGWAYVSVGYSLTPEVSLTELTQEVHSAVAYVHENAKALGIDPQRIVLAGHSAGGHLAATVVADSLGCGTNAYIRGAVLISGVFELGPIAKSYVNDLARITEEEIGRLSPLRLLPQTQAPVHVLVGADEPTAFQVQSTVLGDLWTPHVKSLTQHVAPGRDHFDILDELNDPTSETVQRVLSWG
jgi:arylformamidase